MKYIILVLTIVLFWISNTYAFLEGEMVRRGNRLFENGAYKKSIEKYQQVLKKNPESDIINFNLGTAMIKAGDYPAAVDHLQKALLSDDVDLKKKVHYNLGNALYRVGEKAKESNPQFAIVSWEYALDQYARAMGIGAKEEDEQFNYDFVAKALAQLKEQEQKKQEQEKQSCDQGEESPGQKQSRQESEQAQEENQEQKAQENKDLFEQALEQLREENRDKKKQEEKSQNTEEKEKAEDKQFEDEGKDPAPVPGPNPSDQIGEEGEGEETPSVKDRKAGQRVIKPQELSPHEAKMLLEAYEQNEEPKALFNFIKRKGREAPVLKDW